MANYHCDKFLIKRLTSNPNIMKKKNHYVDFVTLDIFFNKDFLLPQAPLFGPSPAPASSCLRASSLCFRLIFSCSTLDLSLSSFSR